MFSKTAQVTPGKLLAVSLLLVCLPLAALGWLGWWLVEQDRDLEFKRHEDRLQNAANQLADALAKGDYRTPPSGATSILFDDRGILRRDGILLPYYPFVSPVSSELSTGKADPAARATALVIRARELRTQGKHQEALSIYGELITLGATPVLGDPAELVARRQRALLFEAAGDASSALAERQALVTALRSGRYVLDRPTYDLYSENLPSFSNPYPELTKALEQYWPRWQAEPSGRAVWTVNNTAFATVWFQAPEGTVARVAFSQVAPTVNSAYREQLLTAGLCLMATVVLAAGYFVFRAFDREWRVARLRSDFVAHVSHEFRSPLTAMRHLTELLEEGSTPPERLPVYYLALGRETRRLHALVETLLDFGRIESGRRTYQMQETQLEDVARRIVEEFHSPRVQLKVSTPAHNILADRDALAVAVRNLVDNAIKYSPESTEVSVSVESGDGRVGICVADQGAGISPEERQEILGMFVRGSAARTLNVKGTGIGLAMVDQVAKAHGGRVEVESAPGRGSRFTLWVPDSRQTS